MSDRWNCLNDRQRAGLRTHYECDQATEAERRAQAARSQRKVAKSQMRPLATFLKWPRRYRPSGIKNTALV